jgi:hypothetical protein
MDELPQVGDRGSTRPCGLRATPGREAGQASLELVAGLPALLLAGLICLQLLAVGYALTLADGAAEAGALARAAGQPAQSAVREALPGWARRRVSIAVRGGSVGVELRPPSPIAAVAERLTVSSEAWARTGPER